MQAAIFDMDGLLLDTEPLWGESMWNVISRYQLNIPKALFRYTRGLRIYEVTDFWQQKFGLPDGLQAHDLAEEILDDIIERAKTKGRIMPGVISTLTFFKQRDYKIGLATSSPHRMMDALIRFYDLTDYFDIRSTADGCKYGKPHPAVYLKCAEALNVIPWQSVAFEDSVNGMIATKAARMKSVVVPETVKFNDPAFGLADIKLSSLEDFTAHTLAMLEAE